jgi:hypothetical protein
VNPADQSVYHTGKTPYDIENPMEWGFIMVKAPRGEGSLVDELKLSVYKDGTCKMLLETDTQDTSGFGLAMSQLLSEIQEIEQQELFDFLTDDPEDGGVGGLIISTTQSIIPPLTPFDEDYQSSCSLEDYYVFDE